MFSVRIKKDLQDSRLKDIKDATDQDPDLQELLDTIQSGWPGHKSLVRDSCTPYFDFRETLSVHEGIVIKGEAIVIPKNERQIVKPQ